MLTSTPAAATDCSQIKLLTLPFTLIQLQLMATEIRKPTNLHWIALALLIISVCISYVDRGNLGVAATSIQLDLHFRPDQLGLLHGGFFWTYALMQILAGKLIDKWNVNWVLAAGFLLWSAATGLTGLANSLAVLFCLRLLLGVGESVAYPAYSKIIAFSFPEQLRGAANGLIDAGSKLGPAIGVLLGVEMVHRLTWRGMFLAIGAVSLIWLVPWCLVAPHLRSRGEHEHVDAKPPSYAQLLGHRAVWGTMLGLFGANYTWYLLLTWLPYYFESDRHYTHDRLAVLGSLPFWAVAASATVFGFVADALIRRGKNPGRVRRNCVAIGLLGCCAFLMPAAMVRAEIPSNVLFALSCVFYGLFSSNHWALTQRLAGPLAAGKWTGVENCAGNLAGVVAPYVSGVTLSSTHSFLAAFAIACVFLILGVIGFTFVTGPAEPVPWRTVTESSDVSYI